MLVTVLVTIVHVLVSFFLIAVVLLQSGKSGDLAAAFGGQGSLTSITLSIFAARKSGPTSVLSGVKPATTNSKPATLPPAAPPAVPQNQAPTQK